MDYRILDPEEWHKIVPLFERQGQKPPDPRLSSIAVAEDFNGEIVGLLCLQVAVHMEPLILDNPRADFRRLQEVLEGHLAQNKGMAYYCFTEGEKMARIAQIGGFERAGDFWRKVVE